jgi:outer membrane protein TolC
MGRTQFKPFKIHGDFTVVDTARESPDFETLSKNNPSLQEVIAKKNSALFGKRSAVAGHAPRVSLQSGAGRDSSRWPPEDDQWNVGVSVSMPLFEGGLQQAKVTEARAAYRQAIADERSARDSVIVALEQAWVSLQDEMEAVNVQQEQLAAIEERSKIAEAQYSTGFIAFDNWIIIQNTLVSAKKSYLEAQSNALYAEANWIQAKGETLEYAQ